MRQCTRRILDRYVDVFKEMSRSDPAQPVGRFDEVVAGSTGMLAAEGVGENERFSQLTGVHEKARAVDGPWSSTAHKNSIPRGRAAYFDFIVTGSAAQSVAQKMFCGRSRPRGAGFPGAK